MTTDQGSDEKRVRHLLRRLGVGHDAAPVAPVATVAPARNADWWDDLYAEEQPDPPADTRWLQPQPGYYPPIHIPAPHIDKTRVALSPKTRAALYNISAAGAGWGLGLEPWLSHLINECGTTQGIAAALVLGAGLCLVIAHFWDRRTRHWWVGLAWAARIPLATALTALALYAPGLTS